MTKRKKSPLTPSQLVAHAKKAMQRAHAPYSHFRVGAALLTKSGKLYTGCNVEVSSFSLTLCAERTAVFKAISDGESSFQSIAVISDSPAYISPCGACRQVMAELAPGAIIHLADAKGKYITLPVAELLPLPFDGSVLKNFRKK